MTTYTAKVIEICDNGDAIVELPPDLLNEMGWKEGTVINISLDEEGKVILSEKK